MGVDHLERRDLPAPLAWSFGADLPTPRGGVAAILAADQSVAVLGGPTTDVPHFFASYPSWTTSVGIEPGPLDIRRLSPGVGTLPDGTLFVYGGVNQGTATDATSTYDPTGDNTQDGALMHTPRASMGYATDANHHVYAIGGIDDSGVTLASGEWYDQAANQWHTIAPLPKALSGLSCVADGAGHIFAIGGFGATGTPSSSVYEYTIATNSWSTAAPLPTATADGAAVLGPDGVVYAIGGVTATGTTAAVLGYNPATNQWTTETSLPAPVSSEAAAVDSLGRIVVAGGFDASGNAVASIGMSQELGQPDTAPTFTSAAPPGIPSTGTYQYQIWTTGNPQPTYSLITAPSGASIDPSTGLLTWTPNATQLGTQSFTVRASNSAGQTPQSFSLTLSGPAIATASLPMAVPNVPYSYTIQATGNPAPTFSLTAAPAGMTIDPSTGVISWTPTANDVGEKSVTVRATSVAGQATQTLGLPVQGLAPTGLTLTPASTTSIRLNWAASTSPDGVLGYDVYRLKFVHSPRGSGGTWVSSLIASLVPTTSYVVTGLATSGPGTASYVFDVKAVDPQTGLQSPPSATVSGKTLYAPMLWGIMLPSGAVWGSPVSAVVGRPAQVYLLAYGNLFPTFSAQGGPSNLTVDPVTGLVTFTPTSADVGLDTFTFVATNSVGTSSMNVSFDVAAQVVPSIRWPSPGSIVYGTALDGSVLDATATDPGTGQVVPGSFAYTPGAGTVPIAGAITLSTTFTPTDTTTYATVTTTLILDVQQAGVTPTLRESAGTSTYGQSVTYTATLPAAGLGAVPTGTVTFYDGTTAIGTAAVASTGIASLAVNSLGVGSHSISATYGGNSNYLSNSSAAVVQTVGQSTSTTVASSSSDPSVYGQGVTYSATVLPAFAGAPSPTGTVTFMDGNQVIGTGTLAGGVATFTPSGILAIGSHSIGAAYGGDADFHSSTSARVTQVVNKDATGAAVSVAPGPSVFGQSVTLTATIAAAAPGSGTPGGTVTFKNGTANLATVTLVNGSASYTTSALSVGSHSLTAVYSGNGFFTTSTSPVLSQVVSADATAASLASSVPSSRYGQSVSLTATVAAAAPGSGTPTGSVTFYDGATSLGSAGLSSGKAVLKIASLAVGNHSITAVYNGSSNFLTSTSGPINQAVSQASTTTAIASAVAASVYGQAVTFTATVAAVAPGGGTPGGTVTFYDGANPIGTGNLSGGKASLKVSKLSVGTHAIGAVYAGSLDDLGSSSASIGQAVNPDATTIALTTSAAAPVYSQAVTFTARVAAAAPGSGPPTGTITFMAGTTVLGTVAVGSSGSAVLKVSSLAVGSHSITAVYNGDTDFLASTSAALVDSVGQAKTTTSLTGPTSALAGRSVTFSARVRSVSPATVIPTGTITLLDGGVVIGVIDLGANGVATFSTSKLARGTHQITAVYSGDTDDLASTSSAFTITIG